MLFNLKNNKLGMTLVEMVISLVILSILMTSTMGMIVSSNSLFISTSQASLDKRVGNGVFDLIEKVMRYTTHLSIYDASKASEGTSAQSLSLRITDNETNSGEILYKGKSNDSPINLYDNSFYNKRTVQYSIKEVGSANKHIKLVVKVFREGEQVYYREAIIKCVNLNLVGVGDGANPITDQSGEDAVNQFITFSVDEMLLAGGKNAFSIEYKVGDYIAKYNAIQKEYTAKLTQAYGKLTNDYNAETNPGVKGTTDDERGRIKRSDYSARVNAVTKIIFGDGASPTSISESIDNCVNLRDYYQKQIKDLLKFNPTAAGFTDGNFTKRTIGAAGADGKFVEYTTHTGDAFYGVVATKEELYAGFMFTYYDENKDGKISKEEYPQFEGDSFFAGTSIQNYVDNTSGSSANKMAIMAYFQDNVSEDNYKSDLTSTYVNNVFAYDGEESMAWDQSLSPHYISNYPNAFGGSNSKYYDFSADAYATHGGILTGNGRDPNKKILTMSFRKGYRYEPNPSKPADGLSIGSWNERTPGFGDGLVGNEDEAFEDLQRMMGGNLKPLPSLNKWVKSNSDKKLDNRNREEYCYTVESDLLEGWYYFEEGGWNNTQRYVVYLEAAEVEGIENNLAVKAGTKIYVYRLSSEITHFYYDQAQFSLAASGEQYTLPTEFTAVKAHQFTDYVLYGVDWNSWFKSSPSGLLNKVMTGSINIIKRIFGRDINADVSYISPENAVQSLGNRGQYTTSNFSGNIASYNLAWVVYSPKRGTWYYLPSGSTRLSNLTSSISLSSNKDQPVPLDVEIGNGKTWYNSTAMVHDIETRKMSSAGLFGLVDTTSDIMWVSLPTGNTIDTDALDNNLTVE